jgi:rod shape-determining protein MreD
MRQHDFRWLVVFGCNVLLVWLVGLANHNLARFSFLWIDDCSLHLYLGGLLVTFAALRLDLRHGFTSTILTGLAVDSLVPVPFGTSMVLFGLVHAVLFYGRQRFPREEVVFATVVALLSNLFLFLALSFILVGRFPHPGGAWLHLFADLLASQFALVLVTPWFMALQGRAFELVRLNPETGRRVSI